MSHINLNEIDLNKLQLAKSGRLVKLMYNKEPLQLVTGKLYSPFGVKVNPNNYSAFNNCHLDCSLNQNNSEVSVAYRNSLEKLDEKITELISNNTHLFNATNGFDTSMYSPVLRENKSYPKLMKISLPRDSKGNFTGVVFNEKKEKVQLNDNNISDTLPKGLVFKSILECGKVWYYNGRFGTTWNLVQLIFSETQPTNNSFLKVDDKLYESNMMLD